MRRIAIQRGVGLIVAIGAILGLAATSWAAWPYWRPLDRSAADIEAAWSRAEAWMPEEVHSPDVPPNVRAIFSDVPWIDMSEPSPEASEVVVRGALAWLHAGQPLPLSRCLLAEPDDARPLSAFDVFSVANHLIAAGHPDAAVALGQHLEGGNVVLHSLAVAIYALAVEQGAHLQVPPAGQTLLEAVAAEVRCADEVLGKLQADPHAFDDGMRGGWWTPLARERQVHRRLYGELLPELAGLIDDPAALAARLEAAVRDDPYLNHTVAARLLSVGVPDAVRTLADSQAELDAAVRTEP